MKRTFEEKKMDHDCAICRTDLGTLAFEKCSSDQEVTDLVFRLKCGHAFHNGCLCRALRAQESCPSCRETKNTDTAREFEFQVGTDGNIIITVPQDAEADGPINNFVTGIRDVMAVNVFIDRSSEVQSARAAANKAHRRYRAAEASIMNRRCELIKDALQRLGHEKRDFFNKEKGLTFSLAACVLASFYYQKGSNYKKGFRIKVLKQFLQRTPNLSKVEDPVVFKTDTKNDDFWRITVNDIMIDMGKIAIPVRERFETLQKIVSSPDVMHGEPVVIGTRIPAFFISFWAKEGLSVAQIREKFPSIQSDDLIQAAIIWTDLNPFNGRPKRLSELKPQWKVLLSTTRGLKL
jgi:uncharacterized protein (DUF433 family)